jgi:hypothetical protein
MLGDSQRLYLSGNGQKGSVGPTGPSGKRGLKGISGYFGPKGEKGSRGDGSVSAIARLQTGLTAVERLISNMNTKRPAAHLYENEEGRHSGGNVIA